MSHKINGLFLMIALCCSFVLYGQVGIGTINPALGTILHIDDGSGLKGVKLPNADIIDLNTVEPLPDGTHEGTLVYNINAFTGIGHFYWNGYVWAPIQLFAKKSAKFEHLGPIENNPTVNLNQPEITGGVDAELMDKLVFNESAHIFTAIADVNSRFTSVEVHQDGRYRITVFIGLEQDDSAISTGSTAIQSRLKITDSAGNIKFDGSSHRSTEMDRNGTGDDDGTLYFTEIIELNQGDKISVNCTNLEGTAAVYQRDPQLSAFIIEKLR